MTILDMLESDGFIVKKVARTHGGEYAGPCPGCGGIDRFLIWPARQGGRYWCRQCNKSGDAIQYLRDFRNMTYPEACHYLGEEPKRRRYSAMPCRKSIPACTPKESTKPSSTWQEKAGAYLDRCRSVFWSSTGDVMRSWLHEEKGLQDETIRKAGLGFNLTTIYEPRSSWGLDLAVKEDGSEQDQWLPAGIVIPLLEDSRVHRLRIRRMKPGGDPRYAVVSGSSMRPMVLGAGMKCIFVVESELDAWLISQEAGDLCGVIAMGSAQAKPDRITHEVLTKAETILVALDHDDAGAKAAWSFWPEIYGSKVMRWPVVLGKDPSEAWKKGLDIRSWVLAAMSNH